MLLAAKIQPSKASVPKTGEGLSEPDFLPTASFPYPDAQCMAYLPTFG